MTYSRSTHSPTPTTRARPRACVPVARGFFAGVGILVPAIDETRDRLHRYGRPTGAWSRKRCGPSWKNETSASGISKVRLEPGIGGKAGIVVGGSGANTGGLALPLAVSRETRVADDAAVCRQGDGPTTKSGSP